MYDVHEVDGPSNADQILKFNSLVSEWPPLQSRHLENGFWWLATLEDETVAFAGLVPFEPFVGVGYLKRCFVKPDHHGHGLQFRMLLARELKAKNLGWHTLVSECHESNFWSSCNFRKAGYSQAEPEQKWGAYNSIYFVKTI